MKHCQWCDTSFESEVAYQIYCSPMCREEATKEKIAQRYVLARRNKRMGQDRKCKTCGSRLSAYNDDSICFSCVVNPKDVKDVLKEIRGLANGKAEPDIS
jgi:3-hydroxyisobutyrate dehydrogenase-like beta-hydroxyacid dehydrogenase